MYFKYNEQKIYYEKIGNSNNTILIFPGWGDNRSTFKNIIDSLKDKYTIYIFDYPGFGNSNITNKDLTIYDYAEIFINFMNEFNIEIPIGIGHSFGGRLIITMAGKYNINFKKIILIDSAGIKPKKSLWKKIKQLTYKFLKKIKIFIPNKFKTNYLNKLISIFGSGDYKSLPNSLHKTFINIVNEDLTFLLSKIKNETLLIWGEKDLDTPLKDAYKMHSLINDSGLVILKKATHFCYLEQPLYIKIIINNFLNN